MNSPLNLLGIALIVCGIVAVVFMVMSYTQDESSVQLRQAGSVEEGLQD